MKIKYCNITIILFLFSVLLLCNNCGKQISCCIIEVPPLAFTPERTSLENQILGTYQEIREDVWLVSSSQTVEGLNISSSTNTNLKQELSIDYKIIKALETLEYNKTEIKKFKSKGYLGEKNMGLLGYIENSYMESNPIEKQKMYEIMDEVNDSRQVLMLEIINKNENLTLDDLDKVKKTLGDKYKKESKKDEWIQNEEGEWEKKK